MVFKRFLFSKFKHISYVISVIAAIFLLEITVRYYLSPADLLYLPYFGLSNDQHHYLIWKNRPEKNKYSTITYPYSFDIHDEKLGWRVKSNVVVKHSKPDLWDVEISTNKHGFRGKYSADLFSSINVPRIGFIGASQTFGESVNDNEVYVSLLDKKLKDIQVLNFGVRGYGTDQMLLYYENEARKYDLDVVVLAFAFHHIPRNSSAFTFYAKPYYVNNGENLSITGQPIPTQFELFDNNMGTDSIPLINKSILMRVILKHIKTHQNKSIFNKDSETWKLTKLIIKRFTDVLKQDNVNFVLLNIEHEYPRLENEFERLGKEFGINTINLGPHIRNLLESGESILIKNDTHWSALGHEMISEIIYTELCKLKQQFKCV